MRKIKENINSIRDKISEAKVKGEVNNETPKTFVNSFGEATKREITSLAFKRDQRRMEKDILLNMGDDANVVGSSITSPVTDEMDWEMQEYNDSIQKQSEDEEYTHKVSL